MPSYSPSQLLIGLAYALLCAVLVPCLIVSCMVIDAIDIIRDLAKAGRSLFVRRLVIFLLAAGCSSFSCDVVIGGVFSRISHRGMVAQSGIRPYQGGMHEGVGMSSRGYAQARNNACFWGQREVLSVQYSKRGGMYYAVVRYK